MVDNDQSGIEANDRLRLLLERAITELGVHCASAYVDIEATRFHRVLEGHDTSSSIKQLWPFYFPRCYDPVPLVGLPRKEFFTAFQDWDDQWKSMEELHLHGQHAFSYAKREDLRCTYKLSLPGPANPQVMLFFNVRNDRRRSAVRREASLPFETDSFRVGMATIRKDAEDLVTELIEKNSQVEKDSASGSITARYAAVATGIFKRVEALEGRVQAIGPRLPSQNNGWDRSMSRALTEFAEILLAPCASLIDDVGLHGAFHVMARRVGKVEVRQSRKRLAEKKDDRDMLLVPLAETGRLMHSDPRTSLRFFPFVGTFQDGERYSDLAACLTKAASTMRDCFPTNPEQRPQWRRMPAESTPSVESQRPFGLITLAAHWGSSLFLGDVQRRYCEAAPIYADAYRPVEPRYRICFAIPLMRDGLDEKGKEVEENECVGAVVFQATKPHRINRSTASFLHAVCRLAVQKLKNSRIFREEYEIDVPALFRSNGNG